ncbi:uncharacterized protein LOC123534933 [Mercenaria mercenaria]|uniref:uncharacterized protein LOC123534933 n=1 Tax=Mercenaria mercenaria TaxID=6596 RepID=UPI001E1E1417|nr:uncharacterized protein LOC123534933 [Mercenaria mercenaria]
MTEHYTHPVARRAPARRPPRIEMQIRRGMYDQRHGDPWDYGNEAVCDCFPRTSKHTIPSMFYDKIACPHTNYAHIQPAQETQFNYPWTANSLSRQKARGEDDELSERLSLISEEDDQLRFSPNPLQRNDPDVLSIQTAPPYWYKREGDARDSKPPFTAPVNDTQILTNGRRAQSMQDIRDPAYRTDGMTPTGNNYSPTGNRRNSRLSNRQFTGTYVDPRGKAYNYNVNYTGTPNQNATRKPVQDSRKPGTALR